MEYDVTSVRREFPALRSAHGRRPPAYLDGPAGTQTPDAVIRAMSDLLSGGLSNYGGPAPSSQAARDATDAARRAGADLFNSDPDEIVFGLNMTSLTFSLSRALARDWRDGDEIVVTLLEHEANVSPWVSAASERGVTVHTVPFDPETTLLDLDAMERAITPRTRLVAVTHASNVLGTIPDVARVAEIARSVGALTFVDAVHYAPHGVIDVRALACDFAAVSAYKCYGPHVGMLFGRAECLERARAYKVGPAPARGPRKWETGTQSFESLAGLAAAVDHLARHGRGATRRERLASAVEVVRGHERSLLERFLAGAGQIPGLRIHGITDPALFERRTATLAITLDSVTPGEAAGRLASDGVYVWHGHAYAIGAMRQLGLLDRGGVIRIGFSQYNTHDEVDRALHALDRIACE